MSVSSLEAARDALRTYLTKRGYTCVMSPSGLMRVTGPGVAPETVVGFNAPESAPVNCTCTGFARCLSTARKGWEMRILDKLTSDNSR